MEDVARLQRVGLTGPGQRHDALVKLSWLMHVIWCMDSEQVGAEMWSWLERMHNGHSDTFNRSPAEARRRCLSVARAFKWEKVGPRKPIEDRAVRAYVDGLRLPERPARLLTKMINRSRKRGSEAVQIPSETLKTWDRKYGEPRDYLIEHEYIRRGRNYGADIGRCNEYLIPQISEDAGAAPQTPEPLNYNVER
ncbi:MAG: hypothetical protein HOL45_08875 [Chloroflexi bacterium]|nr:hypothetical protein [Chloroflexota bacterium]